MKTSSVLRLDRVHALFGLGHVALFINPSHPSLLLAWILLLVNVHACSIRAVGYISKVDSFSPSRLDSTVLFILNVELLVPFV